MIDHFNIRAPETLLEQVKNFYCTLFEFSVGERPNFDFPGYWLYSGEQALIHLSVGEPLQDPATGYLDHIAFRVQGLDEFRKRLTDNKVVFREKYLGDINTTQLFLHDPSGLKLEANFRGEK